jgi:acyl-CoA synthetase (AMP-forming)/AMP-acid ligase II
MKISSLEIEEALYRHPGILEAAVVAVPHQALGEDIRAFVVVRAGMTIVPDDLRDHCALYLARHKVPRDIRIVEGLSHNTFGKILKSELRQAV